MKYIEMPYDAFRKELIKQPRTIFSKGDHRFQDTYFCSACGFPLVSYNLKTCDYSTKRNMYKVVYNGSIVYMCKSKRDCHTYYNKKKGGKPIRMLIPE